MKYIFVVGFILLLVVLATINQAGDDIPQITNNSNSVGTTGDSFTFLVTVVDTDDPPGNLTVNVSWSHGGLSGDITLVNTGGDSFEESIVLDDSISDMTFTIWATDGSGNMNYSGPHLVTVSDNDPPSIDSITGDTVGSTGETTTIDVTFSDNIGVTTATMYYKTASAGSWSSKSIFAGSAGIDIPLDSVESWYYYVTVDDAAGNGPVGDPSVDGSVYYTVTVSDNDIPSLDADNSLSSGTTGDSYVFDITASDNIGVGSVNVSWSHGSLSGNKALSDDGDGSWSGSIILGGSTDDMMYTVQVNDTSGLFVRGSEQTVTVTDNDYPTSEVIITSYWYNALDNPLAITAAAYDNNGLKNVSLYYYFSTDNISFSGPYLFGVDFDPWVAVSWDFNFPGGLGYYRFYSVAVDNTSLIEPAPVGFDASCGYDILLPMSAVMDIGSYWIDTTPLIIIGAGIDTHSGLHYVTLYYYNSTDNITWTGPHSFGADTIPWDGISWTFNFPSGSDQHYRFYSIATDNASNIESAPGINDTMCFFGDNIAPSIPSTPFGTTSITVGKSAFYSTSSTDGNNDQIKYGWDWNGDGTIDEWTGLYNNGSTVSTSHTWGSIGTFQVKVKACDEHGMFSSWSQVLSVTVNPSNGGGDGDGDGDGDGGVDGDDDGVVTMVPPVADAGGPYSIGTGKVITFNGSGSYDPDPDGWITNYTWDFGDNTTGYGVSPTHIYNILGVYNIKLTVTDNDGMKDSNKTTVKIIKDFDGDRWSDEIEKSYGTNVTDPYDYPQDTDNDGTPDDDSPDGKYRGDTDDDNDGLNDETEELLTSDPKNKLDVISIIINGETYYLVDIDGDGESNIFYDSTSGMSTIVKHNKDGTYLIDVDGDGKWDHIYNKVLEATSKYVEEKPEEASIPFINAEFFPLILGIIIVIVITILVIVILFKIGYLYIEEEYEQTKPPMNKSKSKKKK